MGNLGADPELFASKTGKNFCRFSVATNYTRTNDKGEKEQTATWHRVKVFGKTADHCQMYLKKGSVAIIDGYISNQKYKKPDGTDAYSSEVVAQTVSFMPSRQVVSLEGRTANEIAF